MFVEGCKLDKWHINGDALPGVKFDDDAVDGEKEVVIWLLECLGYGVQLALVGAGVVGLRLSRHGADEVTMHSHSEAYHIDSLLYVGFPIAALFGGVDFVYHNVVLFLAVGSDVESGKPRLAGVFRACEKIKY